MLTHTKVSIIAIFFLSTFMLSCNNTPKKAEVTKEEQSEEQKATKVNIGDIAPDFTVSMLDGSSYTLSDLKGKVVLVNFWATWCPPCMQEFMVIPNKIVKPFADEDFVLLAISRGEKPDIVAKKMTQLKKNGIDFPVGLDIDKAIYNKYATSFIPRNFLIDQNGKVVYTSIGYSEEEFAELTKTIAELLK